MMVQSPEILNMWRWYVYIFIQKTQKVLFYPLVTNILYGNYTHKSKLEYYKDITVEFKIERENQYNPKVQILTIRIYDKT